MDHIWDHKLTNNLLQLSLDPLKTKRENDIDVPNQHQNSCSTYKLQKKKKKKSSLKRETNRQQTTQMTKYRKIKWHHIRSSE